MANYVLGLDLGANSVGWAIIAQGGGRFPNGHSIMGGVRIFPAGLENEKDREGRATGQGVPPGSTRRQKRSERRQHWRRAQRRRRLGIILQEAGMFSGAPPQDEKLPSLWRTSPYELRERALSEKLTLQEFARVLYHLSQRRGFPSGKKIIEGPSEKAEKETQKKREIETLQGTLDKEGITLGQYLARFAPKNRDGTTPRESYDNPHMDPGGKREWVRNHDHTNSVYHRSASRRMYTGEFEKLWSAQAGFHPGVLTNVLRDRVYHALFDQRRTWWAKDTVGKCALTADPRCPKGHWLGQHFRLLQEVNNLRVVDGETGEERSLSEQERGKLVPELMGREKMTFAEIRKSLWPKSKKMEFQKIEREAMREALLGNAVEAGLRSPELASWCAGKPPESPLREKLHDTLVETEDVEVSGRIRCYGLSPERIRQEATHDFGMTEKQADELIDLAESLPGDYYQYSLCAIRKIIPHLQKGLTLDKAVHEAGYSLPDPEVFPKLPPIKDASPYLTNPLVHRGLAEARKIVNSLVGQYGKPVKVVIELAREMTKSRRHRQEILKDQKHAELKNRKAAEEAQAAGVNPELRENIRRYRLWQEWLEVCGCPAQCPYCGRSIPGNPQDGVFSREFEIDHILPRSRTVDNFFNNLTLSCAKCNREKGENTPFEAWGQQESKYQEFLHRVGKFRRTKGRPGNQGKYLRFTEDATGDNLFEKWAARLLKATQYMATQAVDYLRLLGCEVECVSGGITRELRHFWGLNGLNGIGLSDEKNRDDHRHHAIDAVVVALTTRKHVHNLCNKYRNRGVEFPPPWPGFREEVQSLIDGIGEGKQIGVSFRPKRGLAGALHEATVYGPVWTQDAEGSRAQVKGSYVTRKRISELTPDIINDDDAIRDTTIRDLIRQACKDKPGIGFPVAPGAKVGQALSQKPLLLPCKKHRNLGKFIPIKRVRVVIKGTNVLCLSHANGPPPKFLKPGANHHVEIYELPDGSWTGQAISRFDANRRLRCGQPVVNRQPRDGSTFVMSLCINDMVLITMKGERRLYRVQGTSVSSPVATLRLHTAARTDDKRDPGIKGTRHLVANWESFRKLSPMKVIVDPLGRIHPCND